MCLPALKASVSIGAGVTNLCFGAKPCRAWQIIWKVGSPMRQQELVLTSHAQRLQMLVMKILFNLRCLFAQNRGPPEDQFQMQLLEEESFLHPITQVVHGSFANAIWMQWQLSRDTVVGRKNDTTSKKYTPYD